jgi:hypothetical protein
MGKSSLPNFTMCERIRRGYDSSDFMKITQGNTSTSGTKRTSHTLAWCVR